MGVQCFTRLTNAFSKKFEKHCHMVAIYHAYYNFCRVHQTLRVRPAMEAGLAGHVWTLEELVGLFEQKAVLANHHPFILTKIQNSPLPECLYCLSGMGARFMIEAGRFLTADSET